MKMVALSGSGNGRLWRERPRPTGYAILGEVFLGVRSGFGLLPSMARVRHGEEMRWEGRIKGCPEGQG